jgi:hypothetical protein
MEEGRGSAMARTILLTDDRLREDLERFEREHGMMSAEFYERFTAGLVEHDPDLMQLAWTYEVAVQLGVLATAARS